MQNTWLGRIYKVYLKKYTVCNMTVNWVWRNGYPVYIAISPFKRKAKRWRTLTNLSEFVKLRGIPTCKLADAACVETPIPKVYPSCDQGYLTSPHDRYEFPEVFVSIISNAKVFGRTNLILADGEVVCHDLYDFGLDYTSEELHGRTVIDSTYKRIRWLHHDVAPKHISVAAAFVDACATNYAHWLTEILPRILVFCLDERFKDIPIIVDDRLHKNILASLILAAGPEREIITLNVGKALSIDRLFVTSVAGYVPFERRANRLFSYSHGVFSPLAFELLRKKVNVANGTSQELSCPEKIFIRRNSGARKVTNAAELEKLVVVHGFVIVEPEKFTFLQQVQLFSNAKVIMGSTGAAMANILFASPHAKIIILISKYPNTSYWYWQNIACASGKTVSYILGEACDGSGIHADFIVNLESVLNGFGEIL
jgi:capsular polysaccharide biosynthesis protein